MGLGYTRIILEIMDFEIYIDFDLCFEAYQKKQEFFGGFLKIKNIKCKNYIDKIYLDKYSKIILQKDMK